MSEPMMRVQARTGQIAEGPDKDKWAFEIVISAIGHPELGPPFTFGPYESEAEAKKAMRERARSVSEFLEKQAGQEPSGKYYDMKEKITRSWEEN